MHDSVWSLYVYVSSNLSIARYQGVISMIYLAVAGYQLAIYFVSHLLNCRDEKAMAAPQAWPDPDDQVSIIA